MDAMNIERVNQSYTAFHAAAGLDDYDRLVSLMNALADSGQAGEGGRYESLFLLLADLMRQQDARHYPDLASPQVTEVRNPAADPDDIAGDFRRVGDALRVAMSRRS